MNLNNHSPDGYLQHWHCSRRFKWLKSNAVIFIQLFNIYCCIRMSVPCHCHILQFHSYRCLVDKCSTQAVNVVVDVVYSPYVPYLLDYPTLQQTFLTEQLQATRLVGITQIIYNITWQLIIRSHRGSVHLHSTICNSVTWDFLGRWWLAVVMLIILTVTMVR